MYVLYSVDQSATLQALYDAVGFAWCHFIQWFLLGFPKKTSNNTYNQVYN